MRPFILGIGGTFRAGSSSEQALNAALRAAAQSGAETARILSTGLNLPHYRPATSTDAAIQHLIRLIRRCDGLIISTPGYHGGMSGIIKNALDYIEELRHDARPYLHGRAIGIIVGAGGNQAIGTTLTEIRSVVHALRGWPTPLAVGFNSSDPDFVADRDFSSKGKYGSQIEGMSDQVVAFARMSLEARAARSGSSVDADPARASL